jgi:phenylpropionate dioxygenase-like ring-hydroxylating dioxygenase large terminal subunit
MPDDAAIHSQTGHTCPSALTRVPFWAYKDRNVPSLEQQHLFGGSVWNDLCLETEIPNSGP